jgi:formylmethanofuran dehydrogenase subunit D
MEMRLNTVRMVDHDQAREHALGDEKSLEQNLAIGILNPSDFKKLNLTRSLHINLSNKNGQVIVAIKEDENIPQGMLLMPVSIWSNQLTNVEKDEIAYKNIAVNVEATRDPITTFKDLLNSIKNKK